MILICLKTKIYDTLILKIDIPSSIGLQNKAYVRILIKPMPFYTRIQCIIKKLKFLKNSKIKSAKNTFTTFLLKFI